MALPKNMAKIINTITCLILILQIVEQAYYKNFALADSARDEEKLEKEDFLTKAICIYCYD